jgi:hypothetical protein
MRDGKRDPMEPDDPKKAKESKRGETKNDSPKRREPVKKMACN